jgi:hypothetical protein
MQLQGLNPEEAQRISLSKGARVELLEHDGYLSVAAGRFKGYQVGSAHEPAGVATNSGSRNCMYQADV